MCSDVVTRLLTLTITILTAVLAAPATRASDDRPPPTREQSAFFENRIRPLLAENCYGCHGQERQRNSLRVDSRTALLLGGYRGPAIVPFHPEESLLLKAVRRTQGIKMPPKKTIDARHVDALERWIRMGAPWPQSSTPPPDEAATLQITAADRDYWAFRPITRPQPPHAQGSDRRSGAIDAFVLARLKAEKITPQPTADRRTLMRRLTFDLTGLPPRPRDVAAFLADASPNAYEKVVDRLLASPRYGERWGRHWLDLVRYAQSDGYEFDGEKPFAWRYRDYVVDSWNSDKPYDLFVREQLAGDELESVSDESLIATGYYRLGVWEMSADDKRLAHYDELHDVIETTSTAFLGLTVACARCHDHRSDPISQRDYYRTLAFFHNMRPYAEPKYSPEDSVLVPLTDKETAAKWSEQHRERLQGAEKKLQEFIKPVRERLFEERLAALPAKLREAYAIPKNERDSEQSLLARDALKRAQPKDEDIVAALDVDGRMEKSRLEADVEAARAQEAPFDWVLAVRERGARPRTTHVLTRGSPESPAERVDPRFLEVLTPQATPGLPTARATASSTGRRRALADWIAAPSNPLTARVIVNRLWRHHFGRGIVATPDDFGRLGERPTHPRLLDWLASELVASGWSLKHIHRLILLSRTYQRSSSQVATDTAASTQQRATAPAAAHVDPSNRLLWRQNFRRLEAEGIRDAILAVSGELNSKMRGRGSFPFLDRSVLAGEPVPGRGWEVSTESEIARRSLYVFLKRGLHPPFFESFDYTPSVAAMGSRSVTTVAPQALLLLNSRFTRRQAEAFAARLERDAGSDATAQIERAYALTLSRSPRAAEIETAKNFLKRQEVHYKAIAGELTFEPLVPDSLATALFAKLSAHHLLSGPRTAWRYGRGDWRPWYATEIVVDGRGPFALWDGKTFERGDVSGALRLDANTTLAGLIAGSTIVHRERTAGRQAIDLLRGYEVCLLPGESRVELRHHTVEKTTTVASGAVEMNAGVDIPFRLRIDGNRLSFWLGATETDADAPILDLKGLQLINRTAAFGVRAVGAAATLKDAALRSPAGETVRIEAPERRDVANWARRSALGSLCLVLVNLSEFIYIE